MRRRHRRDSDTTLTPVLCIPSHGRPMSASAGVTGTDCCGPLHAQSRPECASDFSEDRRGEGGCARCNQATHWHTAFRPELRRVPACIIIISPTGTTRFTLYCTATAADRRSRTMRHHGSAARSAHPCRSCTVEVGWPSRSAPLHTGPPLVCCLVLPPARSYWSLQHSSCVPGIAPRRA